MASSRRELRLAAEDAGEETAQRIVSHGEASEIKFPSQFPLHIPRH